jgi:hypothetical protein
MQMERQQQEQQRQQQLMNENARRQQEESRRLNTNPGSGPGAGSQSGNYPTPAPGRSSAASDNLSAARSEWQKKPALPPETEPFAGWKVDSPRIDPGQIIRSIRSAYCDGQGRPVRRIVRWRHVRIPH